MLSPFAASKKLGVSTKTLKRWTDAGKIEAIVTPGKQRRYDISTIQKAIPATPPKINYIYCRVSSKKQEGDLANQVAHLVKLFPDYEVIQDIGSALNYDRKGLQTLLQSVFEGTIGRVVVTYKDRLVRFGFELFENIISRGGGELVVLNNSNATPEEELTEDLISIVTVFSARVHGLRNYKTVDEEPTEPIKAIEETKDPEIGVGKITRKQCKGRKNATNKEPEKLIEEVH